jgi:hypothetical protein
MGATEQEVAKLECIWQGFGSGCGCVGGADSVLELNPF